MLVFMVSKMFAFFRGSTSPLSVQTSRSSVSSCMAGNL